MKAYLEVTTRKQATALAPWACKIVKVDGGYYAFERISDFERWNNQK